MKTYFAIPLACVALASMLLAGGCVSREEHDKLLAANRNAQAELAKALETVRDMRVQNSELTRDLANRDATIAGKQKELQILESAKTDLQKRFDEIYGLYRQAVNRGELPMPGLISILPAQVDKALRDFAKSNPDLVDYLPNYGMVKLKADLTFKPGSDLVQASAKEALGKFVTILQSPAAAEFNIYIAGHTDDMPISKPATRRRHPNNWYLSVHRAVAVEAVLVASGLTAGRIGAMGFGEYHPVEPNNPNKKGNKANRRVEIWIVPPDRFLTAPPADKGE